MVSSSAESKSEANVTLKVLPNRPEPAVGLSIGGHWAWATVLAILVLVVWIRMRLLDVPLERDEGEYAYAAQLMLQGTPPYRSVYTMKMPGMPVVFAMILTVFGESAKGIHAALMVINLATITMIFLFGRQLASPVAGVAAAASFAVLSVGHGVLGFTANAEHFVILPALAGLFLLGKGLDSQCRWLVLVSCVLLGAIPLIKQQGLAFTILGAILLLSSELRRPQLSWTPVMIKVALYMMITPLLFLLTCLAMLALGTFDSFWIWTMQYPRSYLAQIPLFEAPWYFRETALPIFGSAWGLFLLAGAGLLFAARDPYLRSRRMFLFSFSALSFLAVCPGFFFRPHYFLFLLPVVAILAGVCIGGIYRWTAKTAVACWVPLLAAVLPIALAVHAERAYLFQFTPFQIASNLYPGNPFPQSVAIADYLRSNTPEDARLVVLGSEPQIYFHAQRRSGTGFIYTYPLMENQPFALEMQQQMIREIEQSQPTYLIWVAVPCSWMRNDSSPRLIFEWIEQYVTEHYVVDGLVDIQSRNNTLYYWGSEAGAQMPQSDCHVYLFKRRQ